MFVRSSGQCTHARKKKLSHSEVLRCSGSRVNDGTISSGSVQVIHFGELTYRLVFRHEMFNGGNLWRILDCLRLLGIDIRIAPQ